MSDAPVKLTSDESLAGPAESEVQQNRGGMFWSFCNSPIVVWMFAIFVGVGTHKLSQSRSAREVEQTRAELVNKIDQEIFFRFDSQFTLAAFQQRLFGGESALKSYDNMEELRRMFDAPGPDRALNSEFRDENILSLINMLYGALPHEEREERSRVRDAMRVLYYIRGGFLRATELNAKDVKKCRQDINNARAYRAEKWGLWVPSKDMILRVAKYGTAGGKYETILIFPQGGEYEQILSEHRAAALASIE